MNPALVIELPVNFCRGPGRSKRLCSELVLPVPEPGRLPRLSRLMALALRFQELLRTGQVADYAALARLGHVSRARITQIMNLLLLAPDIQEQILFVPPTPQGRDPIHLRLVQPIALERRCRCGRGSVAFAAEATRKVIVAEQPKHPHAWRMTSVKTSWPEGSGTNRLALVDNSMVADSWASWARWKTVAAAHDQVHFLADLIFQVVNREEL